MVKKLIIVFIAITAFSSVLPQYVAGIESIGTIEPPPGTEKFIEKNMSENGATQDDIAILFFISRAIRLIMIIAGGWATVMILISAYTFITSTGGSDTYQKVRSQLTNAVLGLFIIMITFTVTGLISLILFGDPGFLLNPQIDPL